MIGKPALAQKFGSYIYFEISKFFKTLFTRYVIYCRKVDFVKVI